MKPGTPPAKKPRFFRVACLSLIWLAATISALLFTAYPANASLALDTPDDQNYTRGTAITTLQLPEATGRGRVTSYTLTGVSSLPPGLNFNRETRRLSGTPQEVGTFLLTYTANNIFSSDSTNTTFTVTVNPRLAPLTALANQNYTRGRAITDLELSAATGGTAPLTYTLTGPSGLPAGLEFDAGTRRLSGTPSTAATTVLTYRVTDANGASTSMDFMVTVNADLALDTPDDQNYTLDTENTGLELPAATGGTEPLTYTLTGPSGGALPGGLEFDAGTRTLSGTPSTAGTTTLTYRVTDANGASTSVDFMVTVNNSLVLDTPDDQSYMLDTAIPGLTLPAATGGTAPLTYTLTGPGDSALPGGLTFSGRILSGTPSTAATTVLTYRVTDTNGASTSMDFMVTVNADLALDTPANQSYMLDTAIPGLTLPAATGGIGPLTYTLTALGGLPAGLIFNASTRTLSGTPSAVAITALIYTVTDTNGASRNTTFTVTVNSTSSIFVLNKPADKNYTRGIAITNLQLPAATGGTEPLTYTLTAPGGLPAGLIFNASTRILSGTPSTAGTTTLTYRVSDTNGASTNMTFRVMVNTGLALNAPGNQNYLARRFINNLQLPEATGGTGTLTYTLTGLPPGLSFNRHTRTLSGRPSRQPSKVAIIALIYTVTDANGASANATFTVIITGGANIIFTVNDNKPADKDYTRGIAIIDLQLPAATEAGIILGGAHHTGRLSVRPLTYTLTGRLPPGLNFNPDTRTLSGTPSRAGTFTLTYDAFELIGTVRYSTGGSAATFTVTVSDGLALNVPARQLYRQSTAIPDLQLPAATGGTAPLTYTLTGSGDSTLPGGLEFDADTRTLSGTPSTHGNTTLTYKVTDANNASKKKFFLVTVSPPQNTLILYGKARNSIQYEIFDKNYTLDTEITDLQLQAATGGTAPLTYTLTGSGDSTLPGGLEFDADTRTLSGTPSTPGIFFLTYTVTDANNLSQSVNLRVRVRAGLALTAGDQNYTVDTAIPDLQLPAATGGTGTLTYTLTGPSGGALPGGLAFDPDTRTLSGTPSTAYTTVLTYRVTDSDGPSRNATFRVWVRIGLVAHPHQPADQNYTQGTAIPDLQLPESIGPKSLLMYTLFGLPADLGLDYDPETRILSGTPNRIGIFLLRYQAGIPSLGFYQQQSVPTSIGRFTIRVNSSLTLTAPANQNYTLGTAIPDLTLPEATGGTGTLTYTLTGPSGGALPGGLTFSGRTLSGTPDTNGNFTLTYTVTDANGASTSVDFMVNAGLALTASGNQNYTRGIAITNLQLPAATGSTAPLTYTLTALGGLPAGLSFNASTRTLSGTPSTAGTTTLTYRVSDTNGASTNMTFRVTVNADLALTAPANQNYTQDKAITALQLPEASGGTAPLTYTLTNVPGLIFDPGTRTLSGTPSTATSTTTLTYRVTDANGANTTATFTVTVNPRLALTALANQNYTLDTAIPDLTLPEATGGTGTLTYTLTGPSGGALPGGLTFSGRTLSGTPDTNGNFTLTYTVTDANGASTSVDFMVNAGLALTASGNQNYTRGIAITNLQLPAATGSTAPLTYTLTALGGLPAGLSFNASTRTLSGTPSTAGTTTLTYRVSDTNGANTTATFTVTVNADLALTASGKQTYTLNTEITALELPVATGGTAPLTYTLTGPGDSALPRGLIFDPDTRTLSGTPTEVGVTTLTYMVTDASGASTSVTFTVTVYDPLRLPTPDDQNYTRGTAISNLILPEATGGRGGRTPVYILTGPSGGALPAGLIFDPGTRTLSGTPSTAGTFILRYTVYTRPLTRSSVVFTVSVNPRLALGAPANQNYRLDTEITALTLPEASGGTAPLVYILTGTLPTGLSFDADTRILSGTPSALGTTLLTYKVTDTNGASTSATFTVTVKVLALDTPDDQNYTRGTAIPDLQLPAATGGTAPLTYTLIGLSGLPPGLNFNPGTRTLSGTPNRIGNYFLIYEVTDANGANTTATFTVTVNFSLALDTPDDQNYTLGTAIPDLTLPEATGGTGTLTYTLTGPSGGALPGGLTFSGRTLSGTPSERGGFSLTYEVTDANGASTSVDFMVNAGLALTASGNQNYTRGIAITNLQLPAATGSTAPLTYTLTGPGDSALPGGLIFDPGTRTLSGTPSTAGTTTLTYRVSDTNGANTTATFTVTVNNDLGLDTPDEQHYTLDTAITDLILPVATGGTGTLVYTLIWRDGILPDGLDVLPPGLTFNPNTRTLSGTPSERGQFNLTYEVTDANDAQTSVTLEVNVSDGLTFDSEPANQNYTLNTEITALELPEASGGTEPLTYTLTGPGDSALPGGLTFSGRTLSGTPDTAGDFTLTYTVTDTNGASTSVDFMVIVSDSLTLNARGDQNYTLNTEITALELPEASGGTEPLTYTLTGPGDSTLPGGLDFDVDTRTLSGTPDTADTTVLTYTVTDANDATTSVDFMVMVNAGLALTTPANQNYTLDTAITGLTLPVATGGTAPLTYTLTGLPAGLIFNPGTGTLSGTPSALGTTTLTYKVTDANGASTSVTFTVSVSAELALDTPDDQNYTPGRTIRSLILPAATGGTGTLTYTLTAPGGLPAGLSFNASTRTLSRTPQRTGTTTLTYRVTDANGASTSVDFTVTVNEGLVPTALANQNYTRGTAISNLILPAATGGTGTLTYTLTGPSRGPLPAGLTFDRHTRTLSGTPSTLGTTTLTYRVTDANGANRNATFTVTVNAGLALNPPANQNYTSDRTITELQLPEATGGTGTLTYTLSGLPAGLSFNASTRILSGTPHYRLVPRATLTYMVTDANDAGTVITTSATFTVRVNFRPSVHTPDDQNYTLGTAITVHLPVAFSRATPLAYTLSGLPADLGLSFNASTRTLSGTPNRTGTTTLTYEVTDTNGASTNATFTVSVSEGLALTAPGNQNYTRGTAITDLQLPVATGGTAPLTYTLSGLPADLGLSFNASTRLLSGTPNRTGTTALTYEVTDTNGASTSVDFTVSVSDGLALNTPANQNYTLDTEIDDLPLPVATGGTAPLTYTLTGPSGGALPGGLSFDPGTRTLSGTPSTAATTTLTYTVTDANASRNATFTVTVNAGLALNPPANQNYTRGTAITVQLPEVTGGTAPLTYTLSDLPAGLIFTPDTRTLSGTPNRTGTTTLTYEVTDANGASTNTTFTVTIYNDPRLDTPANQNYTRGTAITDLQLPEATGGTAPLTYTLSGLPTGLIFNPGTRILSGTPSRTGSFTLTYTVTDTNGAKATRKTDGQPQDGTFRVSVSSPLNTLILNKPADENYTRGTAIPDLQLPEATGGTAPLTYTLTWPDGGTLPAGLIFNPGTRLLSGTPSTAGNSILTYMVTDANGASTNTTFTVTVNAGLALNTSGNQNYMRGTAILDLQLPAATGGTGTLTYTLTGLPAGLIFDPGTRRLSGTPSRTGTTALIYTATETNGASRNATFTVTVNADLGLDTPANQSYTLDTAILDLQLPAATGGTAPLTYTLTALGGLPAGLSFNASTHTLSGTPSAVAITALIYTVTDANGASRNATFAVTVNSTPSIFILNKPADENYTRGIAITNLQLPAATGSTAALTYTLTAPGGLPAGLSFNASTRTLSGTPSTAGTTTLTYRVSDTNGASTNMTFRVTVNAGLALNTSGNQNYSTRRVIDELTLPAATGGTGTLTYTLTALGGLPAGLIFDPGTRTLSGRTSLLGATTILTYTVTDDNGASANATFTVRISGSGLAPFTVNANKPLSQDYTLNRAIPDLQLPAATNHGLSIGGGGIGRLSTRALTYTLTGPSHGPLPAGLSFNASTRTLSGTPSALGTTTLTYDAFESSVRSINNRSFRYASNGGAATFTVSVKAGLALNVPVKQFYRQSTAIPDLQLPAATGGTEPLVYALTGLFGFPLPVGLEFEASTRTLSGAPDTAGDFALNYRVTDANGANTNKFFLVTVSPLRNTLILYGKEVNFRQYKIPDENYTRGTAILNLQLQAATGGTAPLTYTLTGPSGGALPGGLNFNASTRTLSGTPSALGTTTLTYTVTDTNNLSQSVIFRVRVRAGLALNTSGDQNYTVGTAIPDLQLPEATGGTGPLVYTLTGPSGGALPGGLNFNASTRTLSGTPSARGTTTLTYRVSDANGASTATFRVGVRHGGGLVAHPHRPADQNYTQGTAIPDLQLPEAKCTPASRCQTLTYTLTGQGDSALPAGLDFDPRTRTLSGTPDRIGIFALEYVVGIPTTFTVRVNPRLALTAPANQNYTVGTAITGLQLSEATGGTGTLTYTLTGPSGGALPGGLNFNVSTRTLSGTPDTNGNFTLTYTVSDTNGASTSVGFMVSDGLALTASGDQDYARGTAISDLPLPAATGGTGTYTYTLTGPSGGNLPAGLTFTASTRTLSGTPSTADTTTLTYEVMDTNGASTNVTFTVRINPNLMFVNEPANQNYTQGTAISNLQLPEATDGTGTLTYTLTGPSGGNLPAGLIFTAGTRTLSGTPDMAGTTTLTYEVTDDNGASTATFTVTVNAGLALTASANRNYAVDRAIPDLQLPEAIGGTGTLTYTLTGPGDSALPAGLIFDPGTRTLSGTPSVLGTTTLTYTVTGANGASTSVDFMVTVNNNLVLDTPDDQNYTRGTPISVQLPEVTGGRGRRLVYTLTGLPAGLNFDRHTRTLSGTPNTAGNSILTYRVYTGTSNTSPATFTVTVNNSLGLDTPDDQNYTQDKAIPDLELPEASGGTEPLTYTLTGPSGDALPGGLEFEASTRTLSGTPSTAATTTLTYRVTDANGASTSVDFTVTVLTLTALANQNYAVDRAIPDLQLPEAIGGTGTLTYTLTGPGDSTLPAGLIFDPGTRTLSGTPSVLGTTTLTYTVTGANGASTSVDFMVTVNNNLVLDTPDDQNYTRGTPISVQLPEASGGTGTRTYTLTGPGDSGLPGGLTFSGRTLSGTPSTADTFDLTYTVTDANDASTTATFTIIVSDGLALDTPANQNYTEDKAITALELPEADGGTGTLTYTLTGPGDSALPGGLTFSGRTLSGTPDTAATTILTYTVTDTNGANTSVDFTVSVSDGLALTASGNQNYTLDTEITALELPEATGGTGTLTYTLTSVPGLNFNANTRTLSGTPSTADTFDLTYTVTDANDASTTATFTIIVSDGLALDTPANQNYTEDKAITALELPEADGGTGTLTYTLTSVPGLNFAPDTRTLSGTPDMAGTTTLTYEVTDANGANTSATFMVIVSDGLALTASGNQNYTLDTAITALSLPMATGGTGTLTYTLTSVPGLNFNANTRTLSGTPSTADTTVLTYTVTDANDASTTATFTIIVSDGLALDTPANQNYTEDKAITALELPEADGGTGTLTYTLTGPGDSALPGGLTFSGRTLSGTPDTAATTILTYTVTDTNGANTSVDFTVSVSDGLALTASGNQNYTLDTEITALELPEATGGTGTLTYTLTSVPGLNFNANTRTLSGTPSTADTTVLTYTVTDANDASTTATFTIIVSDGLALDTPANQNYTEDKAITALELPEADGGTGTLTYTLTGPGDSALPGGLTFSGRTLSGTPDTAATTILTYTVTDTNGANTSVDFTVSVSDGLALTASGNQNYTLDTEITALTLPVATGGTGTLTYTLTSVPGLSFTPGTRTLSGTPSTADTFDLTYEVSDANNASTTATFTIIVSDGLALDTPANQNYTEDKAITALELPEADGGTGTLTYTLTGPGDSALPGGLTFSGRTLSGTPDTAATTILTYTVTDTNGATTSVDFTVSVSDSLTLTLHEADQNSGTLDLIRRVSTDLDQLPVADRLTYTLPPCR